MENRLHKSRKIILTFFLAILAAAFLFPLALTITNSFMSETEINTNYGMVTGSAQQSQSAVPSQKYANLKFVPDTITLRQYYEVLIKKPEYLIKFWNSVLLVVPIVLGQLLASSLVAYAFAKIRFFGRDKLFFLYIVVMLMPFQVTLVPNYIMADKLGLIGKPLSIILPGVFGTFGVFLLRQFMVTIPEEYSEAARVDGASHWTIFRSIILPMTKTGIAAFIILSFIDNWNMVEQPLVFLQKPDLMPLSVFLGSINEGERGIAFAAAALYMTPMIFIFLYWENYLVEGIQMAGLKG